MTTDYTNIHIKRADYERLKTVAQNYNKSVPDFIKYLLTRVPPNPKPKPNPEPDPKPKTASKPTHKTPASSTLKDSSLMSWAQQYVKDVGAKRESKNH